MQRTVLRYGLAVVVIGLLGFKSVYFRKLDEVKRDAAVTSFDANTFARKFYNDQLLPRADSAVELSELLSMLRSEPGKAFNAYSNALAIGNIRYFMVTGEGIITTVSGTHSEVALKGSEGNSLVSIATEFVYGNAIRDASGLIKLSDFSSTAEINSISENINSIVREEVIPTFLREARPGMVVKFAGAVELNQKYLDLEMIEIVPIRLTVIQ